MLEYKVIRDDKLEDLEKSVKKASLDGFTPIEGVAFAYYPINDRYHFLQSVVKTQ